MARKRTRSAPTLAFDALAVEGALIAPAMLARIAMHQAGEQAEADYNVPKGLTLRDEIARYFRIGQALFTALTATQNPSAGATIKFAGELLREVLGFADIKRISSRTLGDRQFAITVEGLGGRVPIVVVPPADELDRPTEHLSAGGRKGSAASAIQDWLNADEASLWGFCCNGFRLRLVRDNQSLTRPAYIEADLRAIFEEENFADFTALWLLVHASRFGQPGTPPSDCALERWREVGQREGVAARDRLRDGVEAALLSFGNGFLGHPQNGALREKLRSGELTLSDFFSELLRLVYRLIFLLAAEDRDLLHPPGASAAARKLYAQGYSLGLLRESATRRSAWDRHDDRWEGLKITFSALARSEQRLGLPALEGLFAPSTLQDLESVKLANRTLMEAVYRLAWLKDDAGLVPVNWRDMETEELGSVYESLLELTPQINGDGYHFKFAEGGEAKGHARKTTGSYYTPDSLVQTLLDSALNPVLDRVEAEADDPAAALLSLTVLDPACGSGHFLLAAARRIATRLARARTHGLASPADFRHAMRDVARACIHGVDRNPMAVELTKVALWIETVDPGKPLGFLDANIRCGDALLGIFDLKALENGIPDAAYKPLAGDDKAAAKIALQNNRAQREEKRQHELKLTQGAATFARVNRAVRTMPEDDVAGVRARARAYEATHTDRGWWATKTACDLYVAAFLRPKCFRADAMARAKNPDLVPTTRDVRAALSGHSTDHQLVAGAVDLAAAAGAFHWPLEFPDIIASGGFDVVLGNPPWDKLTLLEREFFAAFPEVATESNAARRSKALEELFKEQPSLKTKWTFAQRQVEATGEFIRHSGRYPTTAVGELNLYPLFAELAILLRKENGWAGLVLKSLIFTGSTWSRFTDLMVTSGALRSVFDFKNWESLFPGVGYHERFCLASIGPRQKERPLRLAVGLTNASQLDEPNRHLDLARSFPRRVNPDTGTLPQCESGEDITILARIAERWPTLGSSDWKAHYSVGLHMTGDAGELRDRERLESDGYSLVGNWFTKRSVRYAPVYEGKLIQQYDHRFASFDGIPRSRRFGIKAATNKPTEVELRDRSYEILPRYWVSEDFARENVRQRGISEHWNLAFRDTTNVISNFRTAIGCVVGPAAFNYKCPNIVVDDANPRTSALFLALFNSTPFDYLLRLKFYGANLTKSLLMQSFVLPKRILEPFEDELVAAVCSLTNASKSVEEFVKAAGCRDISYARGPNRHKLRARIDALVFHLFGLSVSEATYIFETFRIWGEKQSEEELSFIARDLALELLASLQKTRMTTY